jgi:hypothetical protein
METFLKQTSIKQDNNCYCISPFNFNELDNKINPITGRKYNDKDKKVLEANFKRMSNQRDCRIIDCCDPNDTYENVDPEFLAKFKKTYPSVSIEKSKNTISKILLSTVKKDEPGWIEPTPYIICKVSKSSITPTEDPTIKESNNIVSDCFKDSCDNLETSIINLDSNTGKIAEIDQGYTAYDDARVVQAILEGDDTYVKTYIRQYESVDNKLIHDDYRNRMIHIAAQSNYEQILKLLLALKANIDIANKDGDTPLHFSVRYDQYNNTEQLIKVGANLNIGNKKGESPIFECARTGNIGMMRLLYTSGANHYEKNNNGDNLINVCVKDCIPSSDKVSMIRFLIDRGLDTEDKNKDSKTSLEIVKDELEKEYDTEKYKMAANYITKTEGFTVNEIDSKKLTPRKRTLLEIQTLLFNAIIRANPEKYKGYINVNEIPPGAPIEIINHVCVGEGNILGDENSEECYAKGGHIRKVDKPTTLVKLELIPNAQSAIDEVSENDLYYKKYQDKVDINKTTRNLEKYNKQLGIKSENPVPTININNEVITRKEYNEEINRLKQEAIDKAMNDLESRNDNNDNLKQNNQLEHPQFQSEDQVAIAIPTSTMANLITTPTTTLSQVINNSTNVDQSDISTGVSNMFNKYKFTLLTIFIVMIIIVLCIVFRNKIFFSYA